MSQTRWSGGCNMSRSCPAMETLPPEQALAIRYFYEQGVDVKIISGDHPAAAAAVARLSGVRNAGRLLDATGLTDEELTQAAGTHTVFGRVTPQQKKVLVAALQKQGHRVAMTGNGVNDLLAMRQADCSAAMGNGSDAAKQAAQLVLLDSDFAVLRDVISEGRRVVNNLTKSAGVFFIKTIYSVLLSILCLILNTDFPFIPIQITLIDAVIEAFPAFFMSFERSDRRVEGSFLDSALRSALPNGIAIFLGCIAVFFAAPRLGLNHAQMNLVMYLTVGIVSLAGVAKASLPFNLLHGLKRQNYPAGLIDVYVVADNCTDRTAETAHAHGARVLERHDRSRVGKGFALSYLLRRIRREYDAYLVFDADNVVDRNYFREINKTFSAGYDIVTSYRNSKNYGDNWISSGYGLWFLREAQYLNRPRAVLGASCGVSGTGFLFSHRILEQCGGWNFFLLTEDIEFTAYNIVNGEKIGYCPTAVFYDEQPTGFRQSVRQRMRWVRGYLQVLRRYGGKLVRGCFRGSFSCFDMLLNIAPAAILAWVSVLINLAAAVIRFVGGADVLTVVFSIGQSLLNLCLTVLILGLITTISEWKQLRCSAGRKILAAVTFPLFMLTYLPVTVAAIVCKPDWKPITHSKSVSAEELARTGGEEI